MPFNGNGSFSAYTPGNPAVTGSVVSSTAFNNTVNDIATGLSNTLTRDGQSPATANIPMGGNKLTGLANGTAATDAAAFGQFNASTGAANVGFIQSGTGAVATTVQSKLRESVSVKDFGAVGDGVTNDTDAFNKAIAASLNIYIPPGTYLLSPTATWASTLIYLGINTGNPARTGLNIRGAGVGNTTLKLGNSVGASVLMFGSGNTDNLVDMTFSDFTIDLNGANNNIGTIYNNAFYFYSPCTDIKFERLYIKNAAGQQTIRVGNCETSGVAGFGNNITVRGCTFDTFGLGGGWSTNDISVLYIQADNVKIIDNIFTNPVFTFNPAKGHTAIEVNGATSTIIRGNSFKYVQLPTLIDSFYQNNYNTEIQGNTYYNCNYLCAFDPISSTFDQSKVTIKGNSFVSTVSLSSSVIQIGNVSDTAKTREDILIEGNVINGFGTSTSGVHIVYAPSTYLKSLVIQNNDIGGFQGALFFGSGTVKNSGVLDLTIQNNRLDSLGQLTGGGCSFVIAEYGTGTINSLNVTGNTFLNTSANSYALRGAVKLSGNINYVNVTGNSGAGGIGTTYPIVMDLMTAGTWTSKTIDSSIVIANTSNPVEIPVDYRTGFVTIGAGTSVNLFDFSSFTLNNCAVFEIDLYCNAGGTNSGDWTTYKIQVGSFNKVATLITRGAGNSTLLALNFSGSILRVTSTAGIALFGIFRIKGLTTLPITWLI